MKKSDLKAGMRVKDKKGRIWLLMETKNGLGGAHILNERYQESSFNVDAVLGDDLTFIGNMTQNPSSDIVEVYDIPKFIHEYFSFMNLDYQILWKRVEPKKLTVAEIGELLGYPVEVIK